MCHLYKWEIYSCVIMEMYILVVPVFIYYQGNLTFKQLKLNE